MGNATFYRIAKCIVRFFMHIFFRIRLEGLEHVPKDRGFILCANHTSNFDPVFVAMDIPPRVHFMAKAELFRNKLLRTIVLGLGAFPVERGKGDTGAIDTAEKILQEKRVLGMFPEGTRSKDGVPLRPKSGAALIAGQTGADVLPVGVSIRPKLRPFCTVTIRFGKLIPNGQLGFREMTPSEIKNASRLIMDEIISLLEPFHVKQ